MCHMHKENESDNIWTENKTNILGPQTLERSKRGPYGFQVQNDPFIDHSFI